MAGDDIVNPEGRRIRTWHGTGCDNCSGTGYRGRQGIFELMELNDEIRSLVMKDSDAGVLTEAARRHGMRSLREDGWLKIENGVTTVEEVIRVTQEF
jgi:type II secretory ATPase GspE/PulE/Tfp pilus assembly ATPase PilB-like protein